MFRAARSRLGEWWDAVNSRERYGTSVSRILDSLYDTVDEVVNSARSDRQAVDKVAQTWRGELRKIARLKTTKPLATGLLDALDHLAQQAVDDDPFRELLDKVEAQSAAIYKLYWRQVRLSLGHVRDHPRLWSDDPYPLLAATSIAGERAEIQLDICPAKFGPAAYAAIPLVFVHECICHVPARQDRNSNQSAFAEGFLDWAAVFFFRRWMAELDPELAPAAQQHGSQLSEILMQPGSHQGWAARSEGHREAEVLVTWLQKELGRQSDEAQNKVAHLAVELNQTEAPLPKKDQFVSSLMLPLPPSLENTLRAWESGAVKAAELLEL